MSFLENHGIFCQRNHLLIPQKKTIEYDYLQNQIQFSHLVHAVIELVGSMLFYHSLLSRVVPIDLLNLSEF